MKAKYLLSTAVLAVLAVLAVEPAFAQTSDQLSSSLANVGRNIKDTPILINYASYIIGTALGVTGVVKLKEHVDNPGNKPIKDGLGRVAAAAMFISLPSVLRMARGTTDMGTDSADFIHVNEIDQDFSN